MIRFAEAERERGREMGSGGYDKVPSKTTFLMMPIRL